MRCMPTIPTSVFVFSVASTLAHTHPGTYVRPLRTSTVACAHRVQPALLRSEVPGWLPPQVVGLVRRLMGAKVADGVDGTETWVAPREAAGGGAMQDEAEAAGCMLWDLCVQEEHADYLARCSSSCTA